MDPSSSQACRESQQGEPSVRINLGLSSLHFPGLEGKKIERVSKKGGSVKRLGEERKESYGGEEGRGWRKGAGERDGRQGAHSIITAAPWGSIFSSVPRGKRAPAYTGQAGHLTACFFHLYLIKLVSIYQPPLCLGEGGGGGRQAGWRTASVKENGVPCHMQTTVG